MKAKIVLSLVIDTACPDLPDAKVLLEMIEDRVEGLPFLMCVGSDLYNLSTHLFVDGIGEPWVDQVVLTESLKEDRETLG